MIRLSDRDRDQLVRILRDGTEFVREQAAQHDYRADACSTVGERILLDHHRHRANLARFIAAAMAEAAEQLRNAPHVEVAARRDKTLGTSPKAIK